MKTMGSARWVCADVFQVADGDNMFVMKTMITFTGPALKGYILLVSYIQYTAEPLLTYGHLFIFMCTVYFAPWKPFLVKSLRPNKDNCGRFSVVSQIK